MNNLHIVFLGPPGAGKGTQAEKWALEMGVPHINVGSILRKEMSGKTTVGNIITEYMEAGKLVPEEIAINVTLEQLSEIDSGKGFVLDGYPRTIYQAQALEKTGVNVDVVILLEVDDDTIIDRMSGRRCCSECGTTYHIKCHPSMAGNNCEICSAELVCRVDDNPDIVKSRLDVYHEKTAPLIDFYDERQILYRIDGTADSKQVFSDIHALIKFDNP